MNKLVILLAVGIVGFVWKHSKEHTRMREEFYFKGKISDVTKGKWIKCTAVMGKTPEEVCLALANKGYTVKKIVFGKRVRV